MPDMEKVIKGIEICISPDECSPDDCPYYIRPNNESGLCWDRLMTDALALLKEQEPAKPRIDEENDYHCGSCDAIVGWKEITCAGLTPYVYNYCPACGKKVLWDA